MPLAADVSAAGRALVAIRNGRSTPAQRQRAGRNLKRTPGRLLGPGTAGGAGEEDQTQGQRDNKAWRDRYRARLVRPNSRRYRDKGMTEYRGGRGFNNGAERGTRLGEFGPQPPRGLPGGTGRGAIDWGTSFTNRQQGIDVQDRSAANQELLLSTVQDLRRQQGADVDPVPAPAPAPVDDPLDAVFADTTPAPVDYEQNRREIDMLNEALLPVPPPPAPQVLRRGTRNRRKTVPGKYRSSM